MPPYKENEQKRFTERLCVAECEILKVVNFKLDMESNLPFDYIRRFSKVLFSPSLGTGLVESLTKCAIAIGNDSFLTDVNLFYSTQSVSLACVMLAASRFGHPLPPFCLPRAGDSSPEKESYHTTEKY